MEYIAAVVQWTVKELNRKANLERAREFVRTAAGRGAKLVVFPECCNSGYVYISREEALRGADEIPGPFTDRLGQIARENKIYMVYGITEKGEGQKIYNTAILLDPKGEIVGHYRKNNLVSFDRTWFSEGNLGFPVFQTEIGKIGILICGDARLPEIARSLCLAGAEVLIYPTAWGTFDQIRYNAPSRAIENKVWMLAADKVGMERGAKYPGGSYILSPEGKYEAQASNTKEEIVYATIQPDRARDKTADDIHLFLDRRPQAYRLITTPTKEVPLYATLQEAIVPRQYVTHVGAAHLDTKGKSKGNLIDEATRIIQAAVNLYSKIIVLPEAFYIDSQLRIDQWPKMAEKIPGPLTDSIGKTARTLNCYIAYGMIEEEGGKFYNSMVLAAPSEPIAAKYRKVHLNHKEKDWASSGDRLQVFRTDFGNIGFLIAEDGLFPESGRILMLMGADLILWSRTSAPPVFAHTVTPERAIENRCFIAVASKETGRGADQTFIADPRGNILASRAEGQEFIHAHAELFQSRNKEVLTETDLFFHRRPGDYGRLVSL